ncbi:hypothetical protein NEOLEDRAFT_1057477 [Neolentinus lepideus HHB14362 ss-1]|uniref:Uncharacterized protein n=1 Tax=Neolentinus lepideus HHB14362 ss-1 TaxID=1314782 RepID=A0A165V646_9AGAM|nr:hypothetical protein NEOLEDRAFT_1057477 [Neolentinus lepideus HHB14362 ss-1]
MKRARTQRHESESDTESDSDEDSNDENAVVHAGRHFVIMYGPWLQDKRKTFDLVADDSFNEKTRFEKEQNKVQAQLHEILNILPTRPRQFFLSGMSSQRSNTSSRLRRQVTAIFNAGLPVEVTAVDMLSSTTRRDKFQDYIGWIVNDEGQGSYSNLDVAILHKDYDGKFDYKTIFLNPLLMHVFAAIIRGPVSATAMIGPEKTAAPPTDNMELRLGLKNTTPGAIAATAVSARWALSADEKFQSRGAITGINYKAAFEEYLHYLMTGLWNKKASVMNIFRVWDTTLFPNTGSSLVHMQEDRSHDEFRSALEALDADEQELSGEEDNDPEDEANHGEDL